VLGSLPDFVMGMNWGQRSLWRQDQDIWRPGSTGHDENSSECLPLSSASLGELWSREVGLNPHLIISPSE
jgi:hypothetical protein